MPLSSREMEILQFVARGFSNKEIASDLHISRQTVKNHMTAILRKLLVGIDAGRFVCPANGLDSAAGYRRQQEWRGRLTLIGPCQLLFRRILVE